MSGENSLETTKKETQKNKEKPLWQDPKFLLATGLLATGAAAWYFGLPLLPALLAGGAGKVGSDSLLQHLPQA